MRLTWKGIPNYFHRMKPCRSCGKELPKHQKKFCNEACKMESWRKPCAWCGIPFALPERRNVFCSKHCSGNWIMSDPNRVRKIVASKDWDSVGRKISESVMQNREERGRRAKRASTLMLSRSKTTNFTGEEPTAEELKVLKLFPEAIWNHVVRTGLSSKMRQTHLYRLDIAFLDIQLDVEIDGCNHVRTIQSTHDERRTRWLSERGWTVLRFSNRQVRHRMDRVESEIRSTISKLKGTRVTASTE